MDEAVMSSDSIERSIGERSEALFRQRLEDNYRFTDRIFAGLMVLQWLGGIATAVWISPRAWAGQFSTVHIHVWAALILGGVISLYPALLALTRPGQTLTRHTIAVGQMLMSALLIHLTGGRIETHFHVFGSLAFLAFYKDWKVLIPATVIVAVDHWVRGVWWSQSVYGVIAASPWRWVEHAGWVVFEDIVLVISCLQNVRQMRSIAEQTARLEATNRIIEVKIVERTRELSETKDKMVQSEKMAAVGQLAGGVAHEINNPLGVILGFAQGVVQRLKPGDPLEMPLKSIEREALRCKQLIQDLLTFSRAGKTQAEPIDLNLAIQGALSLIAAQAKVRHTELVTDFAAGLPEVQANHGNIQQVIVNLATNAIDAMPSQGGRLVIRTKRSSGGGSEGVEIRVEDNGQGIPAEIRSKIFEPFFTTKGVGKGTGLGLSLVYEIVQKHQGRIQVESEVGKGTVFSIHLPLGS